MAAEVSESMLRISQVCRNQAVVLSGPEVGTHFAKDPLCYTRTLIWGEDTDDC